MRLTRKFKTDYYFNTDHRDIVEKDIKNDFYAAQAMRNKLGQLEDIEEELGVDLITLFKALKNGFYYKGIYGTNEYGKIIYARPAIFFIKDDDDEYCFHSLIFGDIYLEDYGETWALTKEELKEN